MLYDDWSVKILVIFLIQWRVEESIPISANNNGFGVELETLPIFDQLPPTLLSLITPEMVQFYTDGDVILREGDAADRLIILLHGQVNICRDGIILLSRQAYAVIGEQAFIEGIPRTATVVAQGIVETLELQHSLVEQLMENARFTRNLLRIVSGKLAEATNERAYHFRNEQLLYSEFRAHLSPEVTNRLLATGEDYGKPRYIDGILLCADIRSFTQCCADMTPDEIAMQLNVYLETVVDIVHRHDGMVDKFIGDGVLALWGFARSKSDPITQAFACAQEMVSSTANLQFGNAPIRIGVGLNAGQIFIGNVGSEKKRQFTVLGTPVNLVSRYESKSKELGAPIVIGTDFYERLPQELKANLVAYENQSISGAALQTLYTYTPDVGN